MGDVALLTEFWSPRAILDEPASTGVNCEKDLLIETFLEGLLPPAVLLLGVVS